MTYVVVDEQEAMTPKPHSDMRKELEKKGLKGMQVLKGEASNMAGVESQSIHAMVVAQVRPSTSMTQLTWA